MMGGSQITIINQSSRSQRQRITFTTRVARIHRNQSVAEEVGTAGIPQVVAVAVVAVAEVGRPRTVDFYR